MSFLAHEPCPKCGSKDNLARYSEGSAHCFGCGYHESVSGKSFSVKAASDLIEMNECFQALPLSKRKISQETCRKYGYYQGYHKENYVHAETYYDKDRNMCAQKFRQADKTFAWVGDAKHATLFGQHLFTPNANLSVTITEGALDALSIAELSLCKWPVVSLKGGAQGAKKEIQDQFEWLNGFKEIRLCFDNDEVGQKAVEDCLTIPFTAGKLKVIKLPLKDASDMLQAGRIAELNTCLMNAKVYRPDSIINSKDITLEMLMEEKPVGYLTPYPILNEMLRGIFKKRLTLFTSGWGMGKSTILKELAYSLVMEHGLKVGCIFLEEDKQETILSLIGLHMNRLSLDLQEDQALKQKCFEDSKEALFDKGLFEIYEHGGEKNPDSLMNRIEYMGAALDCDFIIFDHITYLVSGMEGGGEGDRKLIDLLLNRLDSIKLRTGVGILTACQLRKNGSQQKGINNGGEIVLQSLKGSGELSGIVDVAIGLEGDQQDPIKGNERVLRVIKNRPAAKLGLADTLEYIPISGRLVPKIGLIDAVDGGIQI